MKTFAVMSIFVSLFSINLYAGSWQRRTVGGIVTPSIGQFSSESMYLSSATCTGGFTINVSSAPGYFFALHVTSGGAAGSWVTLYDSQVSTDTTVAGVRQISSPIPTTTVEEWRFGVALSSGFTYSVDTGGGRSPCFNFLGLKK